MSDLERDLKNVVGSVMGYALDFDKITQDLTERILDSELLAKEQVKCSNCGDKVEEQEVWCEPCAKSFCCDKCNHVSSMDKADLYCPNCLEEVREEAVEEEQTLRLEEIEKALGIPNHQGSLTHCDRWTKVLKTAQRQAGQERYTGEMDLLHELAKSQDINRGLAQQTGRDQAQISKLGDEVYSLTCQIQEAKLFGEKKAQRVEELALAVDQKDTRIVQLQRDNEDLVEANVETRNKFYKLRDALKEMLG